MTDYLVFNELEVKGIITKVFEVRNITNNDLLGTIRWSGAWRQYICRETPHITDWSSGCLKQLSNFIDELMVEWKGLKQLTKLSVEHGLFGEVEKEVKQ